MDSDIRTIRAMREAIAGMGLDLGGLTVFTEAATGPYRTTPVIAALAGAGKVYALARDNSHGSAGQAREETMRLAASAQAGQAIEYVLEKQAEHLAATDILTNSGNVRPIDDETLAMLAKPTTVVPLMYEAWEIRPQDIDHAACLRRGIAVAGTNENHPQVNFFQYLGVMAIKMMLKARFEILNTSIGLACDNSFAPHIAKPLAALGARVTLFGDPGIPVNIGNVRIGPPLARMIPQSLEGLDALLIASSPTGTPTVLGGSGRALIDAAELAARSPGVEVFEFCWGGAIDRQALAHLDISVWPRGNTSTGHMAIIPSALGDVPLVRLQAGGLKVGEILARRRLAGATPEEAVAFSESTGYGQKIVP